MDRETNNIIKFPGETIADIEAAAAAWLARLTSGSLTLAELAEFEFWRSTSPEYDRIYSSMEAMWERMGAGVTAHARARQDQSARSPRNLPPSRVTPQRIPPRQIGSLQAWTRKMAARWRLAVNPLGGMVRMGQFAAVMAMVVMSYQYLSTWRHDYHAASGEIQRVTLADGSIVHLKGGAALDVRFSESGARTVELARGEAFFEVQHDALRPFTVVVGSSEVKDIGTGFLVSRKGESGTVAVEHGVVAVAAGGRSDILNAGDQVSFNQYGIKRKLSVDTETIATWRRRLYIAENKPLGEALSDLDEYYKGRIIVTSPDLAARRINAVVQLDHIDAWFAALSETKNVSVRHWGMLTIVSAR